MNIYSLAVVGLLFIGASYAAEDNIEAVVLNSNLFGGANSDKIEASPYWWMSKGSPFKRAVASGPPIQQFDFSANPFFRSGSSSSISSSNNARLYSAPGYLPPQSEQAQTVSCTGNGRVCVTKYLCSNGVIDASQLNGANGQQCNVENEVCCSIRQPPPPPTRPPTPPPTISSYIPPPPPTPRQPQPTPCYDRSSVCVQSYQCINGFVSNGLASRAPASQCLAPEVCCRVPDERPTQSVIVDQYRPSPTTSRPYVTPAVQTQRPYTNKPFVGNQYIPPPKDNEIPQSNSPVSSYLPPDTGEDQLSEPIASNDNPSVIRPPVQQDQLSEPLPPIQCPAATNCTEIQFCNSDGSISKTPVTLTKDQETYRVPLSDCRDLSRGITGKCCRDLDYTDPWPTNLLRTGAFDAAALATAFDDGQYRPNNGPNAGRNGANGRPGVSRGEAQKSPAILPNQITPAQSQTNKQYTNAPFSPNAIPQNNKPFVPQPPSQPIPFSNQQQRQPSIPQQQTFNQQQQSYTPLPQQSIPQQSFTQQPQQTFTPQQPQQSYTPQLQQTIAPQQPQQSFTAQPQQTFLLQQKFAEQQPQFPSQVQISPRPQQQQITQQKDLSTPFQNPLRQVAQQSGVCATRDTQKVPQGNAPNEAAFGEFPWQAMVLRESTKTILCGGAIIKANVVVTAAHCVDGLRAHDVLIKAGEWKLGSTEEPKPFQTKRVKQITMHPAYQPTNLESDVALLHLENNLNFDEHIGPICIDEAELEPAGSGDECVTSGWGKEIIKYHVANSLPHSLPINPLSPGECQASAGAFNANSAVCGEALGNPCDVDAGSALACTRGNGQYLLKGIYSAETGCGANQIMTFTKMDVGFINGSGQKSLPIQPARNVYAQQLSEPIYPQQQQVQQPLRGYTQEQPAQIYTQQLITPESYFVPSTQAPEYLPPNQ